MAYPVKLTGVSEKADALQIRKFFSDINIPRGNVVICGGLDGVAFVGFRTEQDRQLAMRKNGTDLCGEWVEMEELTIQEVSKVLDLITKQPGNNNPYSNVVNSIEEPWKKEGEQAPLASTNVWDQGTQCLQWSPSRMSWRKAGLLPVPTELPAAQGEAEVSKTNSQSYYSLPDKRGRTSGVSGNDSCGYIDLQQQQQPPVRQSTSGPIYFCSSVLINGVPPFHKIWEIRKLISDRVKLTEGFLVNTRSFPTHEYSGASLRLDFYNKEDTERVLALNGLLGMTFHPCHPSGGDFHGINSGGTFNSKPLERNLKNTIFGVTESSRPREKRKWCDSVSEKKMGDSYAKKKPRATSIRRHYTGSKNFAQEKCHGPDRSSALTLVDEEDRIEAENLGRKGCVVLVANLQHCVTYQDLEELLMNYKPVPNGSRVDVHNRAMVRALVLLEDSKCAKRAAKDLDGATFQNRVIAVRVIS